MVVILYHIIHDRYPSMGNNNQTAGLAPFFFTISSVDTLERKLEEAQRSLGIAPRDFIPVLYGECVSEYVCECVCEYMSECVSECVSEYVCECVSEF